MANAQRRQCVDDSVGHRRGRTDCASFADTLDAERIQWRRRHRVPEHQVGHERQVRCARQRVVTQRTSLQLPVRGVHDLFEQCLSEPLAKAADYLTFDQERVEHLAAVVDAHQSAQLDLSRVTVDFDYGQVSAEGKRRLLGLEVGRDAQL